MTFFELGAVTIGSVSTILVVFYISDKFFNPSNIMNRELGKKREADLRHKDTPFGRYTFHLIRDAEGVTRAVYYKTGRKVDSVYKSSLDGLANGKGGIKWATNQFREYSNAVYGIEFKWVAISGFRKSAVGYFLEDKSGDEVRCLEDGTWEGSYCAKLGLAN